MAAERRIRRPPNPDRVPHPLMSLSFLLSAVLIAAGGPFAWWRVLGAAVMVGLCIFGLYQWARARREDAGRRKPGREGPSEVGPEIH